MRGLVRGILIFLFGAVLGTIFGIGVGFFLFPFVFPPPPGTEQLTEAERTRRVATGTFVHANPADPIHYGRGTVSLYERTLYIEPDFEVGPGPAYRVYLVPKETIRSSGDLGGAMYVDLGPLRAFRGSQRFSIPAGLTLAHYPSVVIWCERFGVLISPADLKFSPP